MFWGTVAHHMLMVERLFHFVLTLVLKTLIILFNNGKLVLMHLSPRKCVTMTDSISSHGLVLS